MRRSLPFWPRTCRAAVVLAAGLSAFAVLPATVMVAGSAAAAPAAAQAPVFTSAPTATIQTQDDDGYLVTASCSPACTFTETGGLPPNVLLDSGGLIQGIPPEGSEGVYHFTITASDGAGTATQAFTLNVTQLAAIGVEGTDGQLWAQAPQLGPGWHALGGKIAGPPAVAAPPNTCCSEPPTAPVFIAAGTNGHLYIRSVPSGWEPLGPSTVSCVGAPAAVITGTPQSGPFTLTVACRGRDNGLWENAAGLPGSGLPVFTSAWKDLGGVLAAGPAAAPVNATMTFFARGTNGRIYTRTLSAGYSETSWSCLGQPNASATPVGGAIVNGVVVRYTSFVCEGQDHALWESIFNGSALGSWSQFYSQGGSVIGSPAIASAGSANEQVVEGTDHAIWVGIPGKWVRLGGHAVGGAGAAALN
jgi:hypothetical protein